MKKVIEALKYVTIILILLVFYSLQIEVFNNLDQIKALTCEQIQKTSLLDVSTVANLTEIR